MKILERFHNMPSFNPFTVEWLTENEKNHIWVNYLYNHSGGKEESSLLESYIFNDGSLSKLDTLKDIIGVMFNDKWNRIHEALTIDYGVIDNYNRVEDSTTDITNKNDINTDNTSSDVMSGGHSNSNNGSDILTGGHTNTNNGTDVMSGGHNINTIDKKSAYDVDTFSNDTSKDETYTFNNETKTENKTDTLVYNNETKTISNTDTFSYNDETKTTTGNVATQEETTGKTTTHSEIKGNIGVTTSQQMIESEIELRKFNLITEMYNDLDTLLTIGVYVY